MDTRSSATSDPIRAPNHLRRDGTDSTPPVVLAVFQAAMTTTPDYRDSLDYCSHYLHCCCSMWHRWLMSWRLMKMVHRQQKLKFQRWIPWKKWAKCWAATDSTYPLRQESVMAFELLVLSSCSSESWRSNSSYPSRLLLRSDTPWLHQLSVQMCFPCPAFRERSFHVLHLLSNRRCRCASKKTTTTARNSFGTIVGQSFLISPWAFYQASETPACSHRRIWLILVYTSPTRVLLNLYCRSWGTLAERSWPGPPCDTRQRFWLVSSCCDLSWRGRDHLTTVFGILSETEPEVRWTISSSGRLCNQCRRRSLPSALLPFLSSAP